MSQTRGDYRQSVGGLVGAVLACLALILVIWGLSRPQASDDVDPAPTLDYAPQLATAREEASFEVVAPSKVPEGWRATSVDWDTSGPVETWELGFLTADDEYVGLDQSNAEVSDAVERATPAATPGDSVSIDGVTWQTLTSDRGETALVSVEEDITLVVTGTAARSELADFAASLSTD